MCCIAVTESEKAAESHVQVTVLLPGGQNMNAANLHVLSNVAEAPQAILEPVSQVSLTFSADASLQVVRFDSLIRLSSVAKIIIETPFNKRRSSTVVKAGLMAERLYFIA